MLPDGLRFCALTKYLSFRTSLIFFFFLQFCLRVLSLFQAGGCCPFPSRRLLSRSRGRRSKVDRCLDFCGCTKYEVRFFWCFFCFLVGVSSPRRQISGIMGREGAGANKDQNENYCVTQERFLVMMGSRQGDTDRCTATTNFNPIWTLGSLGLNNVGRDTYLSKCMCPTAVGVGNITSRFDAVTVFSCPRVLAALRPHGYEGPAGHT